MSDDYQYGTLKAGHYSISLQIPTGLGMPESVYFSTGLAYGIAYVIFAISTGFILKFLPFLHTFLIALVLNLFGSLLYAVTINSAMIIAAQFLAGAYNGIVQAASFAYINSHEYDYQVAFAQKMVAKGEVEPDTRVQHHPRVKETALSLLAFSVSVSYLVGPGTQCLVYNTCLIIGIDSV